VTPLSLTILTASFPAERRGRIVGIAAAGGPLVGGAVTEGIFWINVPVGLLAAVLAFFQLAVGAFGLAWGFMDALPVFRIRSFTGAGATAFLVIGASTSAAFLVSQYFQFALGYSPLGTGLRFLP
jgi:hypothetical protein